MKPDIKADIRAKARELFNERGYNAVSLRNIADALGISVGNLTYHYAKKEDLIEALVLEQSGNYKKVDPPDTLPALDAYFRRMLDYHGRNAYYFRHYTQLAQTSPRVDALQRSVMGDRSDILLASLAALEKSGLIHGEAYAGQYASVVRALMTACIFELPQERDKNSAELKLRSLWAVLYALLTPAGRAQVPLPQHPQEDYHG